MKAAKNDEYAPESPRLLEVTAALLSIAAIMWAISSIMGAAPGVQVLVVALGLVLWVAGCWWKWRQWQMHEQLTAILRKNLVSGLRTPLPRGSVRTSRHHFGNVYKPGPPRAVLVRASGLPVLDAATERDLLRTVSALCDQEYVVDRRRSKEGRKITLREKPQEPTIELSPREQVQRRIYEAAAEIFPKSTPRVACLWDEDSDEDFLREVTISGIPGMELSLSGKRRQILQKLRTRLPKGNFGADVDASEDSICFHRSKPLPSVVVPPKEHAPLLANHKAYEDFVVPLGVGDNGSQATWHPKKDAHLLIIGGTGGGKTIAEHGVIQRLAQAGWRTWLVDGKRVEFIGYRNWPNVELLAQRIDHQIRVIKLAHETMEARYDLIENGKVRVVDLDPIVIVVDELTSLLMAVKRRYQETKIKGMPSVAPVLEWVGDIARLGRTAKMHLVLGLQRPDAAIMGGETRDNFGGRISLGKLQSKEASMMMWDDPAIGVAVPNIKGRAVAQIGGAAGMVQGTYTANPDPNHDDYHPGMVEAMRPTVEAYTRKTIAPPEATGSDKDDEPGEVTWTDITEAKILDSDGSAVEFDPVSSEESKALRSVARSAAPSEASSTLQFAESFSEALDLFAHDPLDKITYGNQLARKLSALAGQTQDDPVSAETPEPVPSQSRISISAQSLNEGASTQLRYVEPGQVILIDDLGGEEIVVSSCEPDDEDPEIYHLAGYGTEGEPVHAELPAETTVETFDAFEPSQ